MSLPAKPKKPFKGSIYKGQIWVLYAPGEYHGYSDGWVLRHRGNLKGFVSSEAKAMECAKLCKVKVRRHKQHNQESQ